MYYLTFYNAPFPHRDMHVIPPCSIQDGFNHAIMMDSSHSNFSMLSMMLKYDDGSFFKKIESEDGDEVHTYYSYDPHGNVKWLVQEIPGYGKACIGYDYDLISGNVLQFRYELQG